MKKPKTLYRYSPHYELEKHKVTGDCLPQIINPNDPLPNRTVFRCRHTYTPGQPYTDFHGLDSLKAAKEEALCNIKSDIIKLRNLYKELSGEEL